MSTERRINIFLIGSLIEIFGFMIPFTAFRLIEAFSFGSIAERVDTSGSFIALTAFGFIQILIIASIKNSLLLKSNSLPEKRIIYIWSGIAIAIYSNLYLNSLNNVNLFRQNQVTPILFLVIVPIACGFLAFKQTSAIQRLVNGPKLRLGIPLLLLSLLSITCPLLISRIHADPHGSMTRAKTDLLALSEDLKVFKKECEKFPSAENWYAQLASDPCILELRKKNPDAFHGRYLREPEDPWKRPIQYSIKDRKATVSTLGRDGVAGGNGEDEDISLEVE